MSKEEAEAKELLKKVVAKVGLVATARLLEEIRAEARAQRAYLMDTGGWS